MIYYIHDNENNVIGFIYNGETYHYKKNIQQDVIGIYDNAFNQIVTYTYDSWGNIISIVDTSTNNIGTINPYRYRSYYYDNETELYYLNTRYYNPKWKRFINADNYITSNLGFIWFNMFEYANNNPIVNVDFMGTFITFGLLVAINVVSVCTIATVAYFTKKGKDKAKEEIRQVQEKVYPEKKIVTGDEFHKTLKKNAQEIKSATKDKNPVDKLIYFKNSVNNGSKYDLKVKSEWKNTVTEMDGLLLEPQDVGNYNFGYIGRAMGYSNEFLQLGAGYNQLTHHGLLTIQNCFTPSFCDDPRDAYFIYLGALKYDNDNK